MVILENIDIDIDIDKEILQNIDIDKISNRFKFGISNRATPSLSPCDSRNLNLSPFCDLSSTTMAMWQPSVLETYGNQTTTYINKTSGPSRLKYPNSMGDKELIMSLIKVMYFKKFIEQLNSVLLGAN